MQFPPLPQAGRRDDAVKLHDMAQDVNEETLQRKKTGEERNAQKPNIRAAHGSSQQEVSSPQEFINPRPQGVRHLKLLRGDSTALLQEQQSLRHALSHNVGAKHHATQANRLVEPIIK